MSEVLDIVELDEFRDLLATEQRVVAKFTAPAWCRPCQQFAPVFKAVASESDESTTFVAVDVDNADWAMAEYDVRGVPTVVLFENGKRVRDLKERTAIKFMNELNS